MIDLYNHKLPVKKKPGINIAGIPSQALRSMPTRKLKIVEETVITHKADANEAPLVDLDSIVVEKPKKVVKPKAVVKKAVK